MSTGPNEGLWIELTCDGNRRAIISDMASQGVTGLLPESLSDHLLYKGYKAGGDATKKIIEAARDNAVGLIAPWTWSTKNWERPEAHADAVFKVTTEFLQDLKTNWIDLPDNRDVRMVHMGRVERLENAAPEMMELMGEICDYTRNRTGMVVAMLMDYSGPDEEVRARELWKQSGCAGSYRDHLDLPRQGIAYRELDVRIRTGEDTRIKHINAVMNGYAGMETREIFREEALPAYTPKLFLEDIQELRASEKRMGK